ERNAAENRFPRGNQPLAEKIGGQHARQKENHEKDDESESGNIESEQRPRPGALRQDKQDLVERREQPVEHPDRDAQRHPDDQAGNKVASHLRGRAKATSPINGRSTATLRFWHRFWHRS